jgi:hypothetical protein
MTQEPATCFPISGVLKGKLVSQIDIANDLITSLYVAYLDYIADEVNGFE